MRFSTTSLAAPMLIVASWAGPACAFDLTTQSLVISGYATSKVTSAPFDNKRILAARDDAAAFIASNGQLQGAQLESALVYLRQTQPTLRASDFELAQVILVQ